MIFQIPPYILFKGERKSPAVLAEKHPAELLRVAVGWTKKGVLTREFMRKHYVPHLRKAVGSDAIGMAVFDCAPAHMTNRNFIPLNFCLVTSLQVLQLGCSLLTWMQQVPIENTMVI